MDVVYIEKEYKDISSTDLKNLKAPFICWHTRQSGLDYFLYLIVDPSKGHDEQFIARFKDLSLAEEYIRLKYNT